MLDRHQSEPAAVEKVRDFSLGEYLAEAGRAIRTILPKQAWVNAVVLEAKLMRGRLSLELIEPFADEHHNAQLKCVVWPNVKTAIESEIGLPLDAATLKGVHARLLLAPVFDPRYHLSGRVLKLDPLLVESLVAKRVEAIRRTLRIENLYSAQQNLATPEDITAVAVIHPDRSAGWSDVRDDLERLRDRGILSVQSFPVAFEGAGSAAGIAEALTQIGASGSRPDLILVIRGGGAAAGLASLANLTLARAVCRCPIPIITGLGHASDRTLIDDLAWRAADTPSKALGLVKSILQRRFEAATDDHRTIVAAMGRLIATTLAPLLASSRSALIDAAEKITARQAAGLREEAHAIERHIIRFRGTIDLTQADLDRVASALLVTAPRVPRTARSNGQELYAGILRTSRARLPDGEGLTLEARRSVGIASAFVERQRLDLRAALSALENVVRRRISEESTRLTALSAAAQALDVNATLRRGFVLPLDKHRRIIRSAEAARAADVFELLFSDGSVACRPGSL